MNQLLKKIFAFAMFCTILIPLRAQVVVTVLTNNGEEHPITLSTGGELQISDESLTVVAGSEATYSYLLDEVSKVLFAGQVSVREVEAGPAISAYPNPAGSYFVLQGVAEGQHQLTVYGSNGSKVFSTSYQAGQQVDISELPQGLYLVRVDNSVTKLIKK